MAPTASSPPPQGSPPAPLATPERPPRHLPGAPCNDRGHCPRYKFTLGQTDDRTLTSQLLTSPEGACPDQRLLQDNWCPCARLDLPEEGAGEGCGAHTSLFSYRVIPGYTGFIPRAQNHFAKTYGQICKEAGQEFARQLARGTGGRRARQDVEPERKLPAVVVVVEKPQLAASPQALAPGVPSRAFQPRGGGPAAAEEGGDPQLDFISGFTGFVPRARYLIGASYPTLSRRAWAEFRQMLRKHHGQESALQRRKSHAFPPLGETYPTDKGLLPHYQGYVPGYKFRFGRTYGHLTYDALGRSAPEKLTPDRLP